MRQLCGLFSLLCLLILAEIALAQPQLLDFSTDFSQYAQTIAQINQLSPSTQALAPDSASGPMAILCRTDGRDIDFSVYDPIYIIRGPGDCCTIYFATVLQAETAAEMLSGQPGVLYAQPDTIVTACEAASPDEITFLSHGAQEMHMDAVNRQTREQGQGSVTAAVIDSGVFPHPMLRGRLVSGGYDYVDADRDSSNDLFGHGTNVAGIIADCTAETEAYLYPIRVLDASGSGKMSNVVNAVREAAMKGVEVINLSLASAAMSQAMDQAVEDAVRQGVTVVIAAGNQSGDAADYCPAHLQLSGAVVVGSAQYSGGVFTRMSTSNSGSSVDVYAPGNQIVCCSRSGGTTVNSGTSMAAPHISAMVLMLKLMEPGLSPAQLEQKLRQAAAWEGVPVPDGNRLVMPELTFRLQHLRLCRGEALSLPDSTGDMSLLSMDENIVSISGTVMTGQSAGETVIVVSLYGTEAAAFAVTVNDRPPTVLVLPAATEQIEAEAFAGADEATSIVLPPGTQAIGGGAFDGCSSLQQLNIPASVETIGPMELMQAVILCRADSAALAYARENGMQYIIVQETQ